MRYYTNLTGFVSSPTLPLTSPGIEIIQSLASFINIWISVERV